MTDAENGNRCFGCGKELEHIPHFPMPQCTGATIFRATGNYGSTVWDPLLHTQALVINICDQCLKDRVQLVQVCTETRIEPDFTYQPWDPDAHW